MAFARMAAGRADVGPNGPDWPNQCGDVEKEADQMTLCGWWVLDGTKSGCLFDDCRHHSMSGPKDWSKMCSCSCCVDSWTLGIGIGSDLGFLLYFTNSKECDWIDVMGVYNWDLNMLYNVCFKGCECTSRMPNFSKNCPIVIARR